MWLELWVVVFIIGSYRPSLGDVVVCLRSMVWLWPNHCFLQIRHFSRQPLLPPSKARTNRCQDWMLRRSIRLFKLAFSLQHHSFATFLKDRVSLGKVTRWHLPAALASCKSWGRSPWNRQDNLVLRKCESWFYHISINFLFKGTENSFVHRWKQSNYCSPRLKGRSGNGCWLFLFHSFAFVNDCWEQLD